jgi:hypothetical protein
MPGGAERDTYTRDGPRRDFTLLWGNALRKEEIHES